MNGVFCLEFRIVDVTRDEVSDYCRHSVYRGRVISTETCLEEKVERTLDIEENCVVFEVGPLEHALQLWDVLLSIRGHCANPPSVHLNYIHPPPPIHTLLVIANKYHLPQGRLKPGQNRQVISDLYLTRLVDNNGLDRDERRETAVDDPVIRQHADCAQDYPSS